MQSVKRRRGADETGEEVVPKKAKVRKMESSEDDDVHSDLAETASLTDAVVPVTTEVKNKYPVYRRSSVPEVHEEEKGKLSTIAKAETKGFKGSFFSLTLVGIPTHYPATDFQCGFCKEALEPCEQWEEGIMNCRGKYANGARVNKHSNTTESFVQHPTNRRHCARGQLVPFVFCRA